MTTTAMTQAAHSSLIRRKPLDRGRTLRRTPLALQPARQFLSAPQVPVTHGAADMILRLFATVLFFGFAILLGILALRVFLWVKTGHFLIKMGAACRSVPSSAGILHPEVHTLDAG